MSSFPMRASTTRTATGPRGRSTSRSRRCTTAARHAVSKASSGFSRHSTGTARVDRLPWGWWRRRRSRCGHRIRAVASTTAEERWTRSKSAAY